MNSSFDFLGYRLLEINYGHNPKDKLNEIRLKIENIKYDNNTLHLISSVEMDYENSKNNKFIYLSGYRIFDKKVRNAFNNMNNDESIDEYLSYFYSSVFPFIRESISSITKDTDQQIILPIIDCRGISLKEALILTPEE